MKLDFIQEIHKSTKREYMKRMNDDKIACAKKARKFDKSFFDGSRRFGYGGYKDDGRWKPMAKKIVYRYGLNGQSSVLDIGCGKGFLARDIRDLAKCSVIGCDISKYAISKCLVNSFVMDAGKATVNRDFDLIISVNALHNLILPELRYAIQNINQHSKHSYIVVESYRNVKELHNLQCWSLTAEQFLRPEEWELLFNEWGYRGDYEFIFFE